MTKSALTLATLVLLTGCQLVPPAQVILPTAAQEKVDFHQGQIESTQDAGNLAITGGGFFILSKVEKPTSLDDLVFTRDGGFTFQFEPGPNTQPGQGTFELKNPDGYFVMGYTSPIIDNVRPSGLHPDEGHGMDFSAFDVMTVHDSPGAAPHPVALAALEFPLPTNPANAFELNSAGQIQDAGDDPRDASNQKVNAFVALAQFAAPTALGHVGGVYWRYMPDAKRIDVGTAGDGQTSSGSRVVGANNTLIPKALETLPVLSPSREDRDRYPDALDPASVLPARTADFEGPMVSGVLGSQYQPSSVRLQFLAQARSETLKTSDATRVVQLRNRVLRPMNLDNLADGQRLNVWLDGAGNASVIEVLRDDVAGEAPSYWL